MTSAAGLRALKTCADSQRAEHFLTQLAATSAGLELDRLPEEQIRVLIALLAGSPAAGTQLLSHPTWLTMLEPERLRFPRRARGLRAELATWLPPLQSAKDYAGILARLREFKQRELVRIAARDLARLGDVVELTQEISDVADVCLDTVWQVVRQQFGERFGQPWHQDADGKWQPTQACVLGMGKLGGQELNYSSDVDVLFVYSEEGQVFKQPPRAGKTPSSTMSNHQYFNRLAEAFIAEVSRMTAEGALYRIDLRLRPEGDAGPLTRSLAGYENYYAQWGQTWERMMLIKARGVAGDASLAAEFLEMIQPFRFPRAVNEGVLREVADMKDRIEMEVLKSDELERNVKLGRGGIREIEFVAQALQLLHAGRQPFLQNPQTLPTLLKLAQYKLLAADDAQALDAAYRFLRDVEHRLQMEEQLQTHTIPAARPAQERLARLMGFPKLAAFDKARRAHTANVRRVYEALFRTEKSKSPAAFPAQFQGAGTEWQRILAAHCFREPASALRVLQEFVEGPGYVHVSPRTVELGRQLLPRLFALCPKKGSLSPKSKVQSPKSKVQGPRPRVPGSEFRVPRAEDGDVTRKQESATVRTVLSDPDRVVTRLDTFIQAYGARATLFEMWTSNPTYFELLLLLFDRSEFLAEAAIRTPDLLDDLIVGGRLHRRKSVEEILRELRLGVNDADQFAWLRRYHEAELMRFGLRDILGLVDFELNLAELSALADACLQYALEVVMREHKLKQAPFAIISLGKLGGQEIVYGSDLDILFVTDAATKQLPKLQKLGVQVMDQLSRRTDRGIVFVTDARLRPDGEKGLLVNTLTAYEQYYRQRAQLWEIQSLTRVRPVAGDRKLGQRFQALAAQLTDFRPGFVEGNQGESPESPVRVKCHPTKSEPPSVGCYHDAWKQKIHEMRMRIEQERTPRGQDDLAIKTGKGGLMDAEFIAQALCLEHGWPEANTLRALERGRAAGSLPAADGLIASYRHLRRVEGILRRWSYEGETVLPDDPAPYYRVAVRCGFATPEEFRAAMAQWRATGRAAYLQYFGG